MILRFFDEDGNQLLDVYVAASNHWEACDKGMDLLGRGTVHEADDFLVIQEPETRLRAA
jgi:putative heme degradation protein